MQEAPFLRSPPFPWVAPEVAAISFAGTSRIDDPEALIAAVRAAEVGGAFWSRRGPWRASPPVRTHHPGSDEAIVGWLRGVIVRDGTGGPVASAVLRDAALDRLAAAAYRDPFEGQPIDPHAAVELLGEWHRILVANRPITAATGMAVWKREAIAQFLWDGEGSPAFRPPERALARGGVTVYWPSRVPEDFAGRAGDQGWAVEDGFLRSSGLGAECRPPMSILVDRVGGIYFDPGRASELETLLASQQFDEALLARARVLRRQIVAARLGKYGVDRPGAPLADLPAGRPIVLAIGQVDGDLSVVHGGVGVASNSGFLERVRAEEPDAFILYRPHPDVVAGLRRGRLADPVAAGLVDQVVAGGSLFDLFERCDSVHVLSSLSGFEALLRGCRVTVHGMPFYAGWGLTTDLAPAPERRNRRLSLDELVAGALILAPRYRDPVTLLPCSAEVLVRRLALSAPEQTLVTGFRRALGATRRAVAGGRRR